MIELLDEPLIPAQIKAKLTDYEPNDVNNHIGYLTNSKYLSKSPAGLYYLSDKGKAFIKGHIERVVKYFNSPQTKTTNANC
jgi:predicted transcriptional regulator